MDNQQDEFDFRDDEYIKKTEKVVKTRHRAMQFLPTVFMVGMLFAVTSISTLININFTLKDVVWSSLLFDMALRLLTLFSAQWIGSDSRYQRDRMGDDVQTAKKRFVASSEQIELSAFSAWIRVENDRIKKEAYLKKMGEKMSALKVKKKRIDRECSDGFSRFDAWRYKKILKKMDDIKTKTTDEYIDDNIRKLRVKYRRLRTSDFLVPTEYVVAKKELYNMSEVRETSKEIFKFFPVSMFFMILGATIGYQATAGTVNAFSIVFDTFSVAMHFSTGWFYVGRKTVSKLIYVFCCKKIVIDRYLADHQNISKTEGTEETKDAEGV